MGTSDNLIAAVQYAVASHGSQNRKGKDTPYLAHLLQVAGLVMEYGGTEDEAIAGLLHDAAEDAGGESTLAQIRSSFGEPVERIVRENSDSITESKENKAPWRERKERYIAAIENATESALLVSICDKIHNARELTSDCRALGDSHWQRFKAPKEDQLWYYQRLCDAFLKRADTFPRLLPAVTELVGTVRVLVELANGA